MQQCKRVESPYFQEISGCFVRTWSHMPTYFIWFLTFLMHLSVLERVRTRAQWVSSSPDSNLNLPLWTGTRIALPCRLGLTLLNSQIGTHSNTGICIYLDILSHMDPFGLMWTYLDSFAPISHTPLKIFWDKAQYMLILGYECSSSLMFYITGFIREWIRF